MAIHCVTVHEQTNRIVSPETRWIAASLTSFSPRNDKCVCSVLKPHTEFLSPPVIARAESPWRSTVLQYTNRLTGSSPPRHDGLPRLSLRSLLAMTKCVCTRTAHLILLHILSSRGRSPWRSTVNQ